MNIQKMLDAYIECALWSSTDFDSEEPLDQDYGASDLHPDTLRQMREDVEDFAKSNEADLMTWDSGRWSVEEMAGHDFWLTRNGHGAGFWDGDWDKDVGNRLTEACKPVGSVDLYVGDDGLIYCLHCVSTLASEPCLAPWCYAKGPCCFHFYHSFGALG